MKSLHSYLIIVSLFTTTALHAQEAEAEQELSPFEIELQNMD